MAVNSRMNYFVKSIKVDNDVYQSSSIIDISNTYEEAQEQLLLHSKQYVKEELGDKAYNQVKIIDILDFNQVVEPIIDSVQLYRLSGFDNRIYVYQKKTSVIDNNGWFGSAQMTRTVFSRVVIFEFEKNSKFEKKSIYISPIEKPTVKNVIFEEVRPVVKSNRDSLLAELTKHTRFVKNQEL